MNETEKSDWKKVEGITKKTKKAYEEWLVMNKDNYLKKKILKKGNAQ